jgi:predicted amidohydrolase
MRIAAANTGNTLIRLMNIDYGITAAQALDRVEWNLDLLEKMVRRAGELECDAVAFSEDTICVSPWTTAHWGELGSVLPRAVERMVSRLGAAAASHGMYLVCASDVADAAGKVRNTAFFLGRDGKEIGRYHKVSLPMPEQRKTHGDSFPVFRTPDLGGVGMLICYDLLFPETARCLSLGGADVIFDPTHGGAAFGDVELSRAAFRTRAAENFTWLVVAWGGWGSETGSMVISPRGQVLAEEKRGGELAIAEIDPMGDRAAADWSNEQHDMRARLYRERRPAAYGTLVETRPPALERLPEPTPGPADVIARIIARAATVGHEEYDAAEKLLRDGRTADARAAFEKLIRDYPGTWFDRTANARLAEMKKSTP